MLTRASTWTPYRSHIAPAGRRRDLDVAEGKSVCKPSEADGSASLDLVLGGVERHLDNGAAKLNKPPRHAARKSRQDSTIPRRRREPHQVAVVGPFHGHCGSEKSEHSAACVSRNRTVFLWPVRYYGTIAFPSSCNIHRARTYGTQ